MEILGTIVGTLVGIASLLAIVIWCGKFIQRVSEHDKKLDVLSSNVDGMKSNVASLVQQVSEHDKKLDILSSDMEELKSDMTSVKTLLMMKYKGVEGILSGKPSPRTLSEIGNKIYEDMNGKAFLEKNKDMFFKVIDKSAPQTAYDVENLCYMACISNVGSKPFNEIKTFLYNYPTIAIPGGKDYEVTMDDACFVLSLPLRDMYLEAHPEIEK